MRPTGLPLYVTLLGFGAFAVLALVVSVHFLGGRPASAATDTASGLKYEDTTVGAGAAAAAGKKVSVHYTGWLDENGKKGKKFDSSLDRGDPFKFPLGAGHVIRGWDEGVAGMKVGGKRTLYIPPTLGYGSRGAPPVIPPNAGLIFDVELLEVQ